METIARRKWDALVAAAAKGEAEAQWELGYYYEYGASTKSGHVLTPADAARALELYLAAATQGHASAQTSLSNLLSDGPDPDYPAAIRWARAAIRQGEASAAYNLGIIHRDLGQPAAAYRHYRLAVAMGDTDAQLQVGLCRLFGHGTRRSMAGARACFLAVLDGPPQFSAPRARENTRYWPCWSCSDTAAASLVWPVRAHCWKRPTPMTTTSRPTTC